MFYKVIDNNTKKIIDVLHKPDYVTFKSHGRVYLSNKQTAQGALGRDRNIYCFEPNDNERFIYATLCEITEEEFTRLENLVNSGSFEIDVAEIEAVKEAKIAELSEICSERIINGFTIKLSDRKEHSFKLTQEDQLNLMQHELQYQLGAKSFIYHATGQPCKVFDRNDMSKILELFRRYIMYHTTYFNVAKHYIKTLTDINKITEFSYGTDVSNYTDDFAIKRFLKGGGDF